MTKTESIAVFLDRDGTIIKEVGYLCCLEDMQLLPDVAGAIRMLNEKGIKAVVVSNQSGVARGIVSEDTILMIHDELQKALQRAGAFLDGIYFCPHHPEYGSQRYRKDCFCRKPNPGMLEQAAHDMNIDLGRSYLIGDTLRDMETAGNAGVTGVMVLTGYGKEEERKIQAENTKRTPRFIASDLLAAIRWVTETIEKGNNENTHR
ncbi:MAG: HAD family hydrolase [Deltaproteobacteria bacterium]|nr:HAD family hydrolase [Deltaproteobacteria bacterium]